MLEFWNITNHSIKFSIFCYNHDSLTALHIFKKTHHRLKPTWQRSAELALECSICWCSSWTTPIYWKFPLGSGLGLKFSLFKEKELIKFVLLMHGATMMFLARTTREMAFVAANRETPNSLPRSSVTTRPSLSSLKYACFRLAYYSLNAMIYYGNLWNHLRNQHNAYFLIE